MAPGRLVGDVVIHRAAEHVHVLLHHADAGAQALLRQGGDVLAVNQDAPVGNIVEAGDQVAKRGLPPPLGPTSATRSPACTFRFRSASTMVVVAVVEADMVEGHVALHVGQLRRVGRVPRYRGTRP